MLKKKNEMYEDLNNNNHKIISQSMQVHNTLGNGFHEVIYQRALAIEMSLANFSFVIEMEMPFVTEMNIQALDGWIFLLRIILCWNLKLWKKQKLLTRLKL